MAKLSSKELEELLSCIKNDGRIVIPPKSGYDSGVHLIDDNYLVVSTDPCINAPVNWFGWLLVHYAASDVTLFGARPEFCTIALLGPTSTKPKDLIGIMRQVCRASRELGMLVVTGHTGTYEGLSTIVGVCTAYGRVQKNRLISPSNTRPGDLIFFVKPLGMEVIINLSLMNKAVAGKLFGVRRSRELAKLVITESCANEALLLSKSKGVHAMHDSTEGGFVTALNELAETSRLGFKIEFAKIPIPKEVRSLQTFFRLSEKQLLSMSSTGSILVAVSPECRTAVEETLLREHITYGILGSFTAKRRRLMLEQGVVRSFPAVADDPYAKILSAKV